MIEGPFIWGMFMQLGRRMWRSPADLFNGEYHSDKDGYVHKQDLAHLKDWKHLQYDEASWRQCTDMMPDCGCNMAVIDIGEALRFPSHPELAAEDAWSPEKMADEVARLRKIGVEAIPKLNFSACHDAWLHPYDHMVSTPEYYRVCADVIRDTAEIFGKPRFFHIGMDEECTHVQRHQVYGVVRQGELFWHDLGFLIDSVKATGCRAWMWTSFLDHAATVEEYMRRVPKDVVQSSAYYGNEFDLAKLGEYDVNCLTAPLKLAEAGYDVIQAGGDCRKDDNFEGLARFYRDKAHLLRGLWTCSWRPFIPMVNDYNVRSLEQMKRAKVIWEKRA